MSLIRFSGKLLLHDTSNKTTRTLVSRLFITSSLKTTSNSSITPKKHYGLNNHNNHYIYIKRNQDDNSRNNKNSSDNSYSGNSRNTITDTFSKSKEKFETLKEQVIQLSEEDRLNDAIKLVTSEENIEFKTGEAWDQLIVECVDKGRAKMAARLFDEVKLYELIKIL